MSTTFTASFNSTHPHNDCIDDLLDNTNTLRSSYSASVQPSNMTDGQLWLDTSGTPHQLKVQYNTGSGSAVVEVGTDLHNTLDFNSNQAKDMRLENVTSSDTPAAGNVGQIAFRTDTKVIEIVRDSGTLDRVVHGNNAHFIPQWVPIGAWDLDASAPPTVVAAGTTPTIRGMEFNRVAELASFAVPVPDGYSDDADLTLRVVGYLGAAQSANATIFANANIISLTGDGELATKTSTNATVDYSISNASQQWALHRVDIPIDFDDATNPVDAGDMLEIEFSLNSTSSVTSFVVRGAYFLSPFGTTTLKTS